MKKYKYDLKKVLVFAPVIREVSPIDIESEFFRTKTC